MMEFAGEEEKRNVDGSVLRRSVFALVLARLALLCSVIWFFGWSFVYETVAWQKSLLVIVQTSFHNILYFAISLVLLLLTLKPSTMFLPMLKAKGEQRVTTPTVSGRQSGSAVVVSRSAKTRRKIGWKLGKSMHRIRVLGGNKRMLKRKVCGIVLTLLIIISMLTWSFHIRLVRADEDAYVDSPPLIKEGVLERINVRSVVNASLSLDHGVKPEPYLLQSSSMENVAESSSIENVAFNSAIQESSGNPTEGEDPPGILTVTGRFLCNITQDWPPPPFEVDSLYHTIDTTQPLCWGTVQILNASDLSILGSEVTSAGNWWEILPAGNFSISIENPSTGVNFTVLTTPRSSACSVLTESGGDYLFYVPDGEKAAVFHASPDQTTFCVGEWNVVVNWQNASTRALAAGAWRIHQSIVQDAYDRGAWDFMRNEGPNYDVPPVTVRFKMPDGHGTHCHIGYAGDPEIGIIDIDTENYTRSLDVVQHEYGHWIMYNVYRGYWPPGAVGPHEVTTISNANLSWTEGWANAFPLICQSWLKPVEDCWFEWGTGGAYDFETCPDCDRGDACEGRVAGALWDIYDYWNDGYDTFQPEFQTLDRFLDIWAVLLNQRSDNYRQFYDAWRSMGKDRHLINFCSYQNTIDYNKSPVLSGGTVDPSVGNSTTLFTFRVQYQDEDWDNASTVKVIISVEGEWPDFDMEHESGDPASGEWFFVQLAGFSPGTHSFFFEARDGIGGWDRDPLDFYYEFRVEALVHLESLEATGSTTNLGTITFDSVNYGLPKDVSKPVDVYEAHYFPASGYLFDHWETTGDITVPDSISNPTAVWVVGDGILRAIYRKARVHLESLEDTGATANIGKIIFGDTSYGLPNDISTLTGSYPLQYLGYLFDHWETTGNVSVSNSISNPTTVTVIGDGTVRAIYRKLIVECNIHLESREDNYASSNLGTIKFDGLTYSLPSDITKPSATYAIEYNATSYFVFDHWETTGDITVSDSNSNPTTVWVIGDGTLRAIYGMPTVNGRTVVIESNTTISQVYVTEDCLSFWASGPDEQVGYVRVIFPNVNTTAFKVYIDDWEVDPRYWYWPHPIINTNGTHWFIYFEFYLSAHEIRIQFAPGTLHLESVQDNGASSNLGGIFFSVELREPWVVLGSTYALPNDIIKSPGYYVIWWYYTVTGYVFDHWETTGELTVLYPNWPSSWVEVRGSGTIRAVYKVGLSYSIHLESMEDTGATANLGTITLGCYDDVQLDLPFDFAHPPGGLWGFEYKPVLGYLFDHWETTGGLEVWNPYGSETILDISGSGTIRAVYKAEVYCTVHLESVQDNGASSNLGWIAFDYSHYVLPTDITEVKGTYKIYYYDIIGYDFDHWETTGGVSLLYDSYQISNEVVLSGSGTLRAIYRLCRGPVHNLNTGLNYTTIQDVIDAAETLSGHTIFVEAGTYYGPLLVHKSLTLIGENRELTIIKRPTWYWPTGLNAIEVTADNVSIINFTIGTRGYYIFGKGVCLFSNGNNISHNIITYCGDVGIWLNSSSHNTIVGNNFKKMELCIRLDNSHYNIIAENNMFEPKVLFEAYVYLNSSSYNSIIKNNWLGSPLYGVVLDNSSDNRIIGNNITGYYDPITGYYYHYDCDVIRLNASSNNIIMDNVLEGAGHYAGALGLYASSNNNTIAANRISKCLKAGIMLRDSSFNNISRNQITQLGGTWYWYTIYGVGIQLTNSSNNNLTENTISYSNWNGIYIHRSSNNTLRNNSMTRNRYNFGVWGLNLSEFINDVDTSNTVDGKPIYYWINEQDRTVPEDAGYVALINCTRITVQNLALFTNKQGILLAYTTNSTITQNTITNNEYGIHFIWSSNNSITRSTITLNYWHGIRLDNSFDNSIVENSITNNGHAADIFVGGGVGLYESSNNNIIGNNITNNPAYGISLYQSSNNNISENNITNNAEGICLLNSSCNSIVGNNITNNGFLYPPCEMDGISLWESSNNTISRNNITNNGYGIVLNDSSDNSIVGNNITNNVRGGIWLMYSSNNSIVGNNITNNEYGTWLYQSSNNKFYCNRFTNNTKQVSNQSPSFANVWDDGYPSGGNSWSDYTGDDFFRGPYQNVTGSDGIGDTPYIIDENNIDHYPRLGPCIPPTTYTLTITTTVGGTTDPSPGSYTYEAGTYASVQAIPDTYYFFDHWELLSQCTGSINVGSSNPITVTMDKDHTLKAIFVYAPIITQYYLTVQTEPLGITTITGEGWHDADTDVSLDAPTFVSVSTDIRYRFDYWTIDDIVVSGNPITVHMDANHTAKAHYTKQYYLTVTTIPDGATTPSGTGWYDAGTYASISTLEHVYTAPDTRYRFNGWTTTDMTETTDPSATSTTVLMDKAKTVTANYVLQYYLTMFTNHGTVSPGSGWHDADSVVEISATAPSVVDGERYVWLGWTGTGLGSYTSLDNPASVTVNGPITETAAWRHEYRLTMATNFGTTSPSAGEHWYEAGTVVTIEAFAPSVIPGERYLWNGWTGTGTGSYTNTDNPSSVTMNGPITEKASWTHQYYLTVTSPYGTKGGEGWFDSSSTAYATVTPLIVDGPPGVRYVFTLWSGDATGTTSPSDPITMDVPKTATANWKTQYTITFDHTGLDGTAVGTVITVDSSTKTYADLPFSMWVDSDTSVSYSYEPTVSSSVSGKQFRLDSVTGHTSPIIATCPTTVTGNYATQYYLTVTSPYDVPGGEGWYDAGETAYATLHAGLAYVDGLAYGFVGWSGDTSGWDLLSDPILMNAPKTAIANWESSTAYGDVRTIGFWKHQVNVWYLTELAKTGMKIRGIGTAQISEDALITYLRFIDTNSDYFRGRIVKDNNGDGTITNLETLENAYNILKTPTGPNSMKMRAEQQLLAVWLNLAHKTFFWNTQLSQETDYIYHQYGLTDIGEAILFCEAELTKPNGNYETAKNICDNINNNQGIIWGT